VESAVHWRGSRAEAVSWFEIAKKTVQGNEIRGLWVGLVFGSERLQCAGLKELSAETIRISKRRGTIWQ
jgi:hypothetical protein